MNPSILLKNIGLLLLAGLGQSCAPLKQHVPVAQPVARRVFGDTLAYTDDYWRKTLTAEQYFVLREKGTERPFSGLYHKTTQPGTYACAGCGTELFSSGAKYDSGTGWPSFSAPIQASAVAEGMDVSDGTLRTEVLCQACGGHLGHLFKDGPAPTGLRYCLNSAALRFLPK